MNAPTRPLWQQDALVLTLLYLMEERGQRFSPALDGDQQFLDDILTTMHNRDLLDIEGTPPAYVATAKGRALLGKMRAMDEQVRQFEVFATVNLEAKIPPEDLHPDDPNRPWDELPDPRFTARPDSTDIRLAMIAFVAERNRDERGTGEVDPHLVVYLQQLHARKLDTPTFWFDLRVGAFFAGIAELVAAAYRWESAGDTRDEAAARMQALYTAGLIERVKREGGECPACGVPLGVFADIAKRQGEELTECPDLDCAEPLDGSPRTTQPMSASERCARCRAEVGPTDRTCDGCGAELDRSLGNRVIEEREVWTREYAYAPVFFDPFDPCLIGPAYGLAFGHVFVC